jgi:hypothetical protein
MEDSSYLYWVMCDRQFEDGNSTFSGVFETALDALAEVSIKNSDTQYVKIYFLKLRRNRTDLGIRFGRAIRYGREGSSVRNMNERDKMVLVKKLRTRWVSKQTQKLNYCRPYGAPKKKSYKLIDGIEFASKLRSMKGCVKKPWIHTFQINH